MLKKGQKLDLRPFSEVLTTEDTDQKVKVLVFWSVYCPPCLESFQHLSEIFKQVKNPDELLVLAITGNNPQEARRKLEEKPLLYAKLISNGGTILNHYQLNSFPTYIITDKNDIITFAVDGIGPQVMNAIRTQLRSLLNQ